ncbi:MAG: thioesterase family protein [Chloroflexota bacterium]
MTAFRFYHPIEVRYGDLDPQGHVNNAKYMTYFEQARVSYVVHLGLWRGGSFFEIGFILADVHLTFKAPLHFGQKVRVGVRTTRLGNKSLTMEYSLEDVDSEQTLATSSSVLVTYDYRQGKTIPIPEHWRKTITDFENLPQES